MSTKHFFSAALLLLALPVSAQEPAPDTAAVPATAPVPLSLEQRMLLRCSAAFALVANRQQSGEQWALAFPPLATRGREFFVQSGALLLDEAGLDPAALNALLQREAEGLVAANQLAQMMPVCLPLLEQPEF